MSARRHLVHAVEAAHERRLATAGGTDDRRDPVGSDANRHVLDRAKVAVVRREVLDLDRRGHSADNWGRNRLQHRRDVDFSTFGWGSVFLDLHLDHPRSSFSPWKSTWRKYSV